MERHEVRCPCGRWFWWRIGETLTCPACMAEDYNMERGRQLADHLAECVNMSRRAKLAALEDGDGFYL